jgi:hypothetical protein
MATNVLSRLTRLLDSHCSLCRPFDVINFSTIVWDMRLPHLISFCTHIVHFAVLLKWSFFQQAARSPLTLLHWLELAFFFGCKISSKMQKIQRELFCDAEIFSLLKIIIKFQKNHSPYLDSNFSLVAFFEVVVLLFKQVLRLCCH